MPNTWSNFLNEILLNVDNKQPRDINAIENTDKKEITILNETDALILWDLFFPETAKFALLFERTYGEPTEVSIFKENEVSLDERKQKLSSMHKAETPVLIYWNNHTALKTNWSLFIKYWDNFFYYPEDAIIFVDQNNIYFYNEMIFKRLTKTDLKGTLKGSIFNCLQQLENKKIRQSIQMKCLFDGVSKNLQDKLYRLFYMLSEGVKVIKDNTTLNEYMEYCLAKCWMSTEKIVLASKPYNKECLQNFLKETEDKRKEIEDKRNSSNLSLRQFYNILEKIVKQQL